MQRMPEFAAPALGNRPNIVTIDADVPPNASGVLYKLGGAAGGLTCYVENGEIVYEYNLFIIQRTKIRSAGQLPTGRVKIEVETVYEVPRPAGPLSITIRANGAVGRPRHGADQRAAAVHRQRLPRHRQGPRLAGFAGLLRPRAVPVHRNDPQRERPLYPATAGSRRG